MESSGPVPLFPPPAARARAELDAQPRAELLVDHGGELRGCLRLERGPLRVVRGEERRLGERAHVVRDRIVSKVVVGVVAVVVVVVLFIIFYFYYN